MSLLISPRKHVICMQARCTVVFLTQQYGRKHAILSFLWALIYELLCDKNHDTGVQRALMGCGVQIFIPCARWGQ
jgi:hypothetical protein